jgi:hypothetical protein
MPRGLLVLMQRALRSELPTAGFAREACLHGVHSVVVLLQGMGITEVSSTVVAVQIGLVAVPVAVFFNVVGVTASEVHDAVGVFALALV